jgi:hypothetical protein
MPRVEGASCDQRADPIRVCAWCRQVLRECQSTAIPSAVFFEDTEEGQDLYKGEFSLAYGTLTLLRKTRLHLKVSGRSGLMDEKGKPGAHVWCACVWSSAA